MIGHDYVHATLPSGFSLISLIFAMLPEIWRLRWRLALKVMQIKLKLINVSRLGLIRTALSGERENNKVTVP